VEEQFYLLWPLTLWLALRLRLRALAVIVFLGVASFGWNVLRLPGSEAAAFFLPQTRLWEILLGAAAAALVRNRSANGPPLLENLGAAVGCAAVIGGAWLAERAGNPPTAWTLLPTAGTALLLCGPTASFIHRHILSQPALIWLGLISYPLYLWHWPLLTLARIRFEAFPGATFRIAVVALSVVLAAGTYYLVERPVRRQRPSRTLAAVLVAALAAVGGLAWVVQRFQGFPDRFPPLLSAIGSYTYDGAASTRLGTYFLMGDRDETAFPHDPHEIIPGRPVLYLWGDSHAASLYTGLKHGYGDRLSIVQRTAAKTPPFMPDAFNPGNARQISQFVFNAIARDRPAEVVLDADWPNYEWRRLGDTIAALRRAGINRVIVIGPVPHWLPTLPQALFNFARRHPGAPVPEYLPVRDSVDLAPLDREMADLCKEQGAEYFSALQALSVPGGYRVRTGANADSLLTFDQSHLTAHGAEYLVEHLPGFAR
jgi:hypothetical protein